jgi:hypothetical protein
MEKIGVQLFKKIYNKKEVQSKDVAIGLFCFALNAIVITTALLI